MKTVVNVKTQEQWDKVTKKLGYSWMIAEWNDYRENSCICLHENSHADIDFFKRDKSENWEIISYDEFIGNKNKEYKLIITPTNSTIIIDKETGKKGMAKLHPDDKYDSFFGIKLAWDRLNGIEAPDDYIKRCLNLEPKKVRTIGELPVGTKIKILNTNCGWGDVKKGDIGNLVDKDAKNHKGEKSVKIDFDQQEGWRLKADSEEGEYFEVVEEDKKLISYEENVSIPKTLYEEFVKWEKLKSLPKLYDSFGEELNEGDRFILINLKDNKNCTDNTSYVKSDGEELFSNGIRIFHNSKCNEGKPINGWQVIKIK